MLVKCWPYCILIHTRSVCQSIHKCVCTSFYVSYRRPFSETFSIARWISCIIRSTKSGIMTSLESNRCHSLGIYAQFEEKLIVFFVLLVQTMFYVLLNILYWAFEANLSSSLIIKSNWLITLRGRSSGWAHSPRCFWELSSIGN